MARSTSGRLNKGWKQDRRNMNASKKGMMEKSAVPEHTWKNHHPIHWEEMKMLDYGRGQELLVKEALHIQMKTSKEHFN